MSNFPASRVDICEVGRGVWSIRTHLDAKHDLAATIGAGTDLGRLSDRHGDYSQT
jgi:hypothetical protein